MPGVGFDSTGGADSSDCTQDVPSARLQVTATMETRLAPIQARLDVGGLSMSESYDLAAEMYKVLLDHVPTCYAAETRPHCRAANERDLQEIRRAYESARASARAGIDALFRARIAGRTFAGTSSMSDPLSIQFLPSGKVISQYGRGNFFSGCKRLGTWHVEDGKVAINCRCKGHSYSVAHAVFDNDVLVGNEEVTLDNRLYRGQKHVFTWRLRERLQRDSATESRAATRRQGQDR